MSVTVLLVRHAPHDQLGDVLSGRTPGLSLGAAGVDQARRLGAWLGDRDIARVQASPLDRTMQTAQAIAEVAGCDVEPVDALNEVDFGDWTGRTFADLAADPAWDAWNRTRGEAVSPGGERMGAAQKRIATHLHSAAHKHDGETLAMVSHCDMIRAAVAWVLGLSLDNLLRFDVDPGSISTLILGDWGGRVLALNERVPA